MRYETNPSVLEGEAAALARARDVVAQVNVTHRLAVLRQAVPGGSTASALGSTLTSWGADLSEVRLGLASLTESVGAAARGYEQIEDMVTAALDHVA